MMDSLFVPFCPKKKKKNTTSAAGRDIYFLYIYINNLNVIDQKHVDDRES
jgi:hypothetical protein